jgi:hypothetical protein
MRKALFWLGVALCVIGIGAVAASVVLTQFGLSPSFNLGDAARFQFILVPFWLVGLGLAVLGAIVLLVSRWIRERASAARGF